MGKDALRESSLDVVRARKVRAAFLAYPGYSIVPGHTAEHGELTTQKRRSDNGKHFRREESILEDFPGYFRVVKR